MITKWTSIKSVLLTLQGMIPADMYNEVLLIEDCARAMDMIGAIIQYKPNVVFKHVENYSTTLPKGLIQINQIAYKKNFILTEANAQAIRDTLGIDNEQYMEDSDLPNLAWLGSNEFRSAWQPLTLNTNTFALSVHCDDCPNIGANCQYSYTVTPDGEITTTFKEGYICISYLSYPLDCDGNFMIPDDEDYKEALRSYCLMRNWEMRWNMKEEGADARYSKYQQLWGLFKAKATASIRMPDVAEAQNLLEITSRLIPKARRFYSFFGNLNSPEALNMGGRSTGYYYR